MTDHDPAFTSRSCSADPGRGPRGAARRGRHAGRRWPRRARSRARAPRCWGSIAIPTRSRRQPAPAGRRPAFSTSQAPYASPRRSRRCGIRARFHPARPRCFLPPARRGGPRIYLPSRRAARHADGSRTGPRAADLLNTADEADAGRGSSATRRRAAGPPAGAARSCGGASATAVRHQRRSGERHSRRARAAARAAANSPGCSRRCGSR